MKGKSNFDSFNLDFLQMQTRGRRRHSSEMNRFMLSKCYEKNSFFISCYFKSKNRSISLGHLISFLMSEELSILNRYVYISMCWNHPTLRNLPIILAAAADFQNYLKFILSSFGNVWLLVLLPNSNPKSMFSLETLSEIQLGTLQT